jgi:hypothetical protein
MSDNSRCGVAGSAAMGRERLMKPWTDDASVTDRLSWRRSGSASGHEPRQHDGADEPAALARRVGDLRPDETVSSAARDVPAAHREHHELRFGLSEPETAEGPCDRFGLPRPDPHRTGNSHDAIESRARCGERPQTTQLFACSPRATQSVVNILQTGDGASSAASSRPASTGWLERAAEGSCASRIELGSGEEQPAQ